MTHFCYTGEMQQLAAEKRVLFGKKVQMLRKNGFVPAVMYGNSSSSEALSVRTGDFLRAWKKAGESTIVGLKVEGGVSKSVLIHEVTVDPLTSVPLHVDFYEVAADRMIKTHVPIEFQNESAAVKSLGGILLKIMHEVEIEALPKDLPHELHADLSQLKTFADHIVIKDIIAPRGVMVLGALDAVVAKVTPPRTTEELAGLETPAEVNLENIEVEKKGKREDAEADEESTKGE